MKILVVDDDPLMLEAIAHRLREDKAEVVTAGNGFEAISIAQSGTLDLIISDLMMPEMSGLSLLCLLKQFYFNRIPVIIISSLDKADVILSSLGLGAEDFISKPIDFERLSSQVKRYAHL
ncbi:MAG TPA: response regulator [Bacteroidia bacterium]|jgi:DNA-binding response OmpR family regulator|nr:response regulator [Bacteroidia bacterium]